MAKLITFPKVLNETGNWLLDMNAYKCTKGSNGSNSAASSPPGDGFTAESGNQLLFRSGGKPIMSNKNQGMACYFNGGVSGQWSETFAIGYVPHTGAGIQQTKYSPLYDSILASCEFDWYIRDDAVRRGKTNNRFRMQKVGFVYRTGNGTYRLKDGSYSRVSGSNVDALRYYTSTGFDTSTGEASGRARVTPNTKYAHPVGMYFQFQTEGGPLNPSDGLIEIWNLTFQSSSSVEALMSPYQTYQNFAPPNERPLWTI
jgi:hypothetical protein